MQICGEKWVLPLKIKGNLSTGGLWINGGFAQGCFEAFPGRGYPQKSYPLSTGAVDKNLSFFVGFFCLKTFSRLFVIPSQCAHWRGNLQCIVTQYRPKACHACRRRYFLDPPKKVPKDAARGGFVWLAPASQATSPRSCCGAR